MSGQLVMAVREARRCRMELRRGELRAAVDCMLWAWRCMGYAEQAKTAPVTSFCRAYRAIDAVRLELNFCLTHWPR